MKRTAMILAMLGPMLASCGLVDCPGMPGGATCCDGQHYCEAGTSCNNSKGTCVSGGTSSGICSQAGAVEYFTNNCHTTTGGIEFGGAAWAKACGTCPGGITSTAGTDNVSPGGPYWICSCT